jgi:hypothetical protein
MTRGEATELDRACADLATEYTRLGRAIRASAAGGDTEAEDRLRNRAQAVLGRMAALGCPTPDAAELGT